MTTSAVRVGVGTHFAYDGEVVEVVELIATLAGNVVREANAPLTIWLAADRFAHPAGSIGQSPPALSSSNSPARANNKPLTTSTHTGNAIVTHMLTSLARSSATAVR